MIGSRTIEISGGILGWGFSGWGISGGFGISGDFEADGLDRAMRTRIWLGLRYAYSYLLLLRLRYAYSLLPRTEPLSSMFSLA